jgi:type I restriction enzyme, S subunit
MSLLDTAVGAGGRWKRIDDFYEVTRKPRGLDLSAFETVPFVPMDSIPQGGAFEPDFTLKPPNQIRSGTYFERDDVLVAKITPSFENGKQALARNLPTPFGYATTEVIPLRPRVGGQDRRLLFFYLLHPDIRHYVAERMEGSTGRQRVSENVLLDLPFPEFGPDEQVAISDALELIQRASVAEIGCRQVARDLKRAAMRTLFTRGIRGEAQKKTEIGPVPESWDVVPCEQIFRLTSGKTRPGDLVMPPSGDQCFPVLGGNGVMGYSSKWFLDAPKLLVIGRVGEYCGATHVASGKVWITDNALYAKEWLNPDAEVAYVGAFLEYFDLNRFKRMAGQPLVTQGLIYEHSIPLPSPDEQGEIVSLLEALERKIDLHRRKRTVLGELFKNLLHKLMTGEIRTADLDLSALNGSVAAVGEVAA